MNDDSKDWVVIRDGEGQPIRYKSSAKMPTVEERLAELEEAVDHINFVMSRDPARKWWWGK